MIIAAAQTVPHPSNIDLNIADHCRLARLAAGFGAKLILFPELSISGYELEKAQELSFVENDQRLDPLRALSAEVGIIIAAGAPIQLETGLHIGLFILFPDGSKSMYTKQYLHDGEEVYFVPGFDHNPNLKLDNESISFAICADITNPAHPEEAAKKGTSLYIASIFYSLKGIANGHQDLESYAQKHNMNVLMANFGGASYGIETGGRSAFWDRTGKLVNGFSGIGEGLVLAKKEDGAWTATTIKT